MTSDAWYVGHGKLGNGVKDIENVFNDSEDVASTHRFKHRANGCGASEYKSRDCVGSAAMMEARQC